MTPSQNALVLLTQFHAVCVPVVAQIPLEMKSKISKNQVQRTRGAQCFLTWHSQNEIVSSSQKKLPKKDENIIPFCWSFKISLRVLSQ